MNGRILTIWLFNALFLCMGMSNLMAQVPVEKSINKVIIEGKVYFIHKVNPGQTLYSISKSYNITEYEIARENPGADKGLNAGQVLKIPAVPSFSDKPPVTEKTTKDISSLKHIMKEGETVYSLSRHYNVKVEDIEKANPGLVLMDIPVGQVINIPGSGKPYEQVDFLDHRVRRKETIYGICRKYGITEEELKMYNPEIRETHPRPGQHLRIPIIKRPEIIEIKDQDIISPEDTIIVPAVESDSLNRYFLSDYYLDSLPPISGRSLNIAFLIPFNYSHDTTFIISDNAELSDITQLQKKKTEGSPDLMPESQDFLEFMEGTLLAVEKLRRKGISVKIFIFDTQRNPQRVGEILNSNRFDKMDLIIGPFFSFNLQLVSEFSRQNHVPVVSPFYDNQDFTAQNPYLFQINPSYKSEFDLLANYLVNEPVAKKIIFIHPPDTIPDSKSNYFISTINREIINSGKTDSIEFNDIVFSGSGRLTSNNELNNSLSRTKVNQIVICETDEAFVKPLVTQLYFLPKFYQVKLFGMPHWMTFQSIDYSYFHHLGLSFFTPYSFSYESPEIKDFLKSFTEAFYAEPVGNTRKGCSYAFIGHDISNYFLNLISRYGRRFISHLDEKVDGQLLNDFKFEKVNERGGFENRSLMMVTFLPDLNISAVEYYYTPPTGTLVPEGFIP